MNYYNNNIRETLNYLNTTSNNGLSTEEAEKRLAENGKNFISHESKTNIIFKFLNQFKDFMVIILIIAAIISAIAEYTNGESNFTDSIIIIVIVVFNAIMGLVQESKADKALDALKSLTKPYAEVIRDGEEKTGARYLFDIVVFPYPNRKEA